MKKLGEPPLSTLQKTKLYFEYDLTWDDIKKHTKLRRIKT